ncbi:uncharacterized protein RCC_09774 [Ramularia collo-cygni]|uniref:Uncharacterized protein n=1 Tax=Ramularia collo-cygni TaxID=112498 RepID=A0A2D3V157_9PEZI|nr:uncharacterized protein RCC_09774 [Ramularia collo-cygni]CZT24057.1 uncharacterized protein RCC_09774 [Ramularia collo-cygni]
MGAFRTAVILEILANISSIIPLILNPDFALSFLVTGPSQITPATRTLARYFGGFVATITVPLLLSIPTPAPGPAGEAQRGTRRTTYLTLGAGEVALGGLMAWAYATGADSGMTDMALLGGAMNLGAFLIMRYVFLFGKPELLEERGVKKTA